MYLVHRSSDRVKRNKDVFHCSWHFALLLQIKAMEISNVCNDFIQTAKHIAITLVDEHYLPVVEKNIQPVINTACHGRGQEGNRGRSGRRYKYEAFNIRFKVCCDDHGLFDGDDESAAKGYGGREVSGSLQYMKEHQPGRSNLISIMYWYGIMRATVWSSSNGHNLHSSIFNK